MRTVLVLALAVVGACSGCSGSVGSSAKADGYPANTWRPAWADSAVAVLRPGSSLVGCTANFLYVDPVTESYYVGTAAHCTGSSDDSTTDGVGTRVELEDFGEIGTVVFDSDGAIPNATIITVPQEDFSLILLDPGINLIANPQMIDHEGPTGIIGCDEARVGDLVGLHGYGTPYDQTAETRSRQGALLDCADPIHYRVAMPVIWGDSGSAVLHMASGRAFGFVSAMDMGVPAVLTGPTLQPIFAALAQAGLGDVALATIDGGYVKP